jgi:MFS family permease
MPSGFHRKKAVQLKIDRSHRVRASLKFSVLDGSAWSAMMGLTQNYMTPFALNLKATNSQISLLSGIPALLTAMAQLLSPFLQAKAGTRKGLILPMVFLNGLMFIPILLVPFIFDSNQVWWLLGFITLSTVAGAVVNPAWGSMMADLVPMKIRGRFFGNRGMINGLITLVFSFIAGGILTAFDQADNFYGYVIIFSAALGFRMIPWFFLTKQYEPVQKVSKNDSPSMGSLIKQVGSSSLGKFTLHIILIDFFVAMSGPYFGVYMWNDLKFGYIPFTLVCSASAVANMIFLHYWGKRADIAGNLKIVKITSMLMPIVPVLWLGSTNVVYLMAANMFSGFVWAGYSLSSVNYVYDSSDPAISHKQLAVFNSMDVFASCLGFLLGGIIVDKLPNLFGFQLRSIFVLSGIGRALVVLVLLRQLSEVRHVSPIAAWDLMKLKISKADARALLRKTVRKNRKSRGNTDE